MKTIIRFSLTALALSAATTVQAARPVEFTVGTEYYNENYREYTNGTERVMRQKGNLWSLNGGVKYRFNERHAAKIEGRYSRGKTDYIGAYQEQPYGSLTLDGSPRRVYDVRALYEYTRPVKEGMNIVLSGGIGHRVLRDLNSRIVSSDYDRKNQTTYAQISAGMNIALPNQFEVSPRIAYNQMLNGNQYSYLRNTEAVKMKQHRGKGIEIDVPVSKKFSNESKLSVGPFYRGWKVFDSDLSNEVRNPIQNTLHTFYEPKNYTHEAGLKLQYSF
ncbi:outer membrane beta-barrel protein [Neisseria sp.]|uniref:outer membrane beta-barrel protein n=1 Tax=Neisseria sp. TaxID=192066 RepID=UPI0035A07438